MGGIKLNKELENTYTLLEEIGSGGGGTVYKAYHRRLKKEVVLKKIHSGLTGGNIRAETDILKNLKSEYLPQVLDFFELGGDVYTVMDFIPGRSLKLCLKDEKKFKQNQVLKWLDQLCEAVEKLHAQNPPIIHGDIKPDNIMLTPENNICLIDFNVSGDFENADVIGYTAGYAAPEQVSNFKAKKARKAAKAAAAAAADRKEAADAAEVDRGDAADADATEVDRGDAADADATEVDRGDVTEADAVDATEVDRGDVTEADSEDTTPVGRRGGFGESVSASEVMEDPRIPVDVRSDIYSIGATVYHLLTGERPGTDKVKPVWEYPVRLEEAFAYLIMKCLERDPQKRFQSVTELKKAVRNVHKSGKKYKALLRRQFLIRLALASSMIGFAALAAAGRVHMRQEKQEKYVALVNREREAREQGDHDGALGEYRAAAALFPEKGEAYLEISLSLYQQKRYEDVVEFTHSEIERNVKESDVLGELYYICGNSCLELEDYSGAADAFQEAILFNGTNAQYYQDYAISLARLGKAGEAAEKLEQAVRYGLGNDGIYYAQGEIACARGDLDTALESFSDCIASTGDDYRKMRAYLMCSRILEGRELSEERISEDIALLEKAVEELPKEYSNALLERLAQAYIDMGELTGSGQYDLQAIETFETIAEYGWATYATYQNMVILCQKNAMYQEGLELLESMLEMFGENYNTYKRMAFMEASLQTQASLESRSYSRFAEYYAAAMKLYQEQLSGNQTDPEMITLQNLYEQAVQGGWIKKSNTPP